MSGNHTPTPWRYTAGESTFQVWGEGEIRVAATSWHGSLRRPYPLKAEAQANVELIVQAVNSYASSQAEIERLTTALARQCDNMAFIVNHVTLHGWYDKFKDELEEDRAALSGGKP